MTSSSGPIVDGKPAQYNTNSNSDEKRVAVVLVQPPNSEPTQLPPVNQSFFEQKEHAFFAQNVSVSLSSIINTMMATFVSEENNTISWALKRLTICTALEYFLFILVPAVQLVEAYCCNKSNTTETTNNTKKFIKNFSLAVNTLTFTYDTTCHIASFFLAAHYVTNTATVAAILGPTFLIALALAAVAKKYINSSSTNTTIYKGFFAIYNAILAASVVNNIDRIYRFTASTPSPISNEAFNYSAMGVGGAALVISSVSSCFFAQPANKPSPYVSLLSTLLYDIGIYCEAIYFQKLIQASILTSVSHWILLAKLVSLIVLTLQSSCCTTSTNNVSGPDLGVPLLEAPSVAVSTPSLSAAN